MVDALNRLEHRTFLELCRVRTQYVVVIGVGGKHLRWPACLLLSLTAFPTCSTTKLEKSRGAVWNCREPLLPMSVERAGFFRSQQLLGSANV